MLIWNNITANNGYDSCTATLGLSGVDRACLPPFGGKRRF